MNLQDDDFALFGLPRQFAQSRQEIDARWKALQRQAHPDRFAAEGAAAQRVAMQWSVRINEARQRLKDPLARAAYLCELAGVPVQGEGAAPVPPEFLMRQMQWRETLADLRGQTGAGTALAALRAEVQAEHARAQSALDWLIDEQGDYPGAARQVCALMFIERFADDLQEGLAQAGVQ